MCNQLNVPTLRFDGHHDALLQVFDGGGTMHDERHHGSFHDVPARFLAHEMPRLYRHCCRGDEFALPFARGRHRGQVCTPRRRSGPLWRWLEGTLRLERFVRGQERLPTRWGATVNGRVEQHLLDLSD
jgi:hypothetical protein